MFVVVKRVYDWFDILERKRKFLLSLNTHKCKYAPSLMLCLFAKQYYDFYDHYFLVSINPDTSKIMYALNEYQSNISIILEMIGLNGICAIISSKSFVCSD